MEPTNAASRQTRVSGPLRLPLLSATAVLVKGEGVYLFDADGRRYLDCFSGVSVMNAGHSNPRSSKPPSSNYAVAAHDHGLSHRTDARSGQAIAEVAPPGLKRSFFCASGSEANEGALLLATLATGRQEFAYLGDALHVGPRPP